MVDRRKCAALTEDSERGLKKRSDRDERGGHSFRFLIFNNTFISMLCFVYKKFKTSVDED